MNPTWSSLLTVTHRCVTSIYRKDIIAWYRLFNIEWNSLHNYTSNMTNKIPYLHWWSCVTYMFVCVIITGNVMCTTVCWRSEIYYENGWFRRIYLIMVAYCLFKVMNMIFSNWDRCHSWIIYIHYIQIHTHFNGIHQLWSQTWTNYLPRSASSIRNITNYLIVV